ncbi:DUF4197 domain-containing protein [Flavobacterium aquicola]|uniref:Uncharacterized protein DUF4197 n=1 Tax=Flavobacterium aquicola TaxID=1682742 RepID=A0A3E0EV27_9FLAO|nr:DUF4197 domain-containing protein [Flavobacterium aquicola]REH02018.1 uncharacterized protein DUF4197 [Flavobacterium aquicola]
MKKALFLLLILPAISNAQFKDILAKAKEKINSVTNTNSSLDIAAGLKEALNKGVTEQVSKLTAMDGFYKNEAVKILMPEELAKVDKTLRKMGMSKLADEGILVLNRAAEDAVKEATPIFVSAIKNITITDAKGILLGNENAATVYLQSATTTSLYVKFNPVVQQSIGKVGADVIWTKIITQYNTIPFVTKINPDLTDYVTLKALDGVFKMITIEEKNIRSNIDDRTSDVLKKVFALQDNK